MRPRRTLIPTIIAAAIAATLLAACSAATGPMSTQKSGPAGAPIPTTVSTVTIHDPEMNGMPAETLTIPAGFKFDGVMMTSPCTTLPWPVFRAYSPDGLVEMRALPSFGWKWSANPKFVNFNGCMPARGPMSAADFLKHFVETIPGGVHVLGPMPVSPTFQQWAQKFADQLNSQPVVYAPATAHNTADTAAIRLETHNGSFLIEQRIRVAVECATYPPGPLQGGNCFVRADVLRAPQGKLDALVQLVDRNELPKPKAIDQYAQAIMAREQARGRAAIGAMNQLQAAQAARMKAMNDQFMSTMQHNHDAFLQQQESQFKSFQANQAANRQARDNAASDWVDFALDRQTTTGAGGTVHVSSQYSHTWSNGQGEWYQTNDPNANPNNVLYGNWSEDTKVHGNGQPY